MYDGSERFQGNQPHSLSAFPQSAQRDPCGSPARRRQVTNSSFQGSAPLCKKCSYNPVRRTVSTCSEQVIESVISAQFVDPAFTRVTAPVLPGKCARINRLHMDVAHYYPESSSSLSLFFGGHHRTRWILRPQHIKTGPTNELRSSSQHGHS